MCNPTCPTSPNPLRAGIKPTTVRNAAFTLDTERADKSGYSHVISRILS